MHLRKLLFFCLFFAGTLGVARAQDIHFTLYNMSPMALNPGNIGKFEGTARIGGIYRGQWASILGNRNQFRTPSAWADAPIIRGFRKQDWVGVGLMFFTDKAGVFGLTHNALKLGAAYHLSLDKKANTVLSLGLHYGGENRRLDPNDVNKIRFEDGWDVNTGDYVGSREQWATDKTNYTDIDGGIHLRSRLNKRMDFSIGFAMYHLTQPNYSIVGQTNLMNQPTPPNQKPTGGGNGNAKLPRRSIVSGVFNVKLSERFTVSPSFLYQTMSGSDEIALQAMGGYLFDPAKDITVNFGLGYRMRDALELLIGFQQKNLRVALAYDVNTSQLATATNNRGGFEIAAYYIFKIYKPAVIKPKVLCPRF